jgi:hypothetical protein
MWGDRCAARLTPEYTPAYDVIPGHFIIEETGSDVLFLLSLSAPNDGTTP